MLNRAGLISEDVIEEAPREAPCFNLFTLIEKNAAHVASILLDRKKAKDNQEACSLATLIISEAFRRAADKTTHNHKILNPIEHSHIYTSQFVDSYDHLAIPLLNKFAKGDEDIYNAVVEFLDEHFPRSQPQRVVSGMEALRAA